MSFAFLTENQLDQWARSNSVEARSLIPTLINDLVSESCPNATERYFPSGDSIGQPGCDGFLRDDNGCPPFVPAGNSCWQIGVGPARKKATEDYRKSTKDVPEEVRQNSTLVLVNPLSSVKEWRTAKGLDGKKEWLASRKKENEWKDIKIIDGTIIIDWIAEHPSIGKQLAQEITRLPEHNIQTVEERWKLLQSYGGSNPLTPDLFLGNRANAIQRLECLLFKDNKCELRLLTRFPDQVADFVCAFIASLEEDNRRVVSGRTLIISDSSVWSTVCKTYAGAGLFLIADASLDISGEAGSRLIQEAIANDHSVIYDAPFAGINDDLDFRLQDPHTSDIYRALTSAGFSSHRAHTITEKSGRNLTHTLRMIRGRPLHPSWADEEGAEDLIFALLVGSWDHNSLADREIVQALTGKDYIEWTRQIRRFANIHNPPVVEIGRWWKFIARFDGWYALGRFLDEGHWRSLCKAATMALCPNRFQIELTEAEYDRAIKEKMNSRISFEIRKGLSETLALWGCYPEVTSSLSKRNIEEFVSPIVQEIVHSFDDEKWVTSDKIVHLLAEASPHGFLDAVCNTIEQDDDFVVRLSSSVYGIGDTPDLPIGLPWAIESLAWSQDFLLRACVLLGKLSESNLRADESNGSLQSLSRILFPLLPQTMANTQNRMKAVKAVLQEAPNTGWRLLLDMFPSRVGTVVIQCRPVWRRIIPDDWLPIASSQREMMLQNETLSDLIVDLACEDYEKLTDTRFVDLFTDLSPSAFKRILNHIASDATVSRPTDQRLVLWKQITALHRKHKEFETASWAMTEGDMLEIEKVAKEIKPRAPRVTVGIVFSNEAFLLTDISDDWDQRQQQIESLRFSTLKDLLGSFSTEEVVRIAEEVDDSGSFGYYLAELANSEMDQYLLPAILMPDADEKHNEFAKRYLARRWALQQWAWVDKLDRLNWTPTQSSIFLSWMPFIPETWNRANAWLGSDEGEYWKRAHVWLPRDFEGNCNPAIEKLVSHNRIREAVECLTTLRFLKKPYDHHLACRVLLSESFLTYSPHEEIGHKIRFIIEEVQLNPDLPVEILLEVEWRHFDLLDDNRRAYPKTIFNRINSDPAYFYKIVEFRWRHRSIPHHHLDREKLSQLEIDILDHAYTLLNYRWKTVPGTDPNGEFHSDVFEEWLAEVYRLCESTDLLEAVQDCLANVIFHAPPDPDGLWIHRTVAKALNDEKAEVMRHSYSLAVCNSRGIHVVEGTGVQEKELAESFRKKAELLESEEFYHLAETFQFVSRWYAQESDDAIRRDDLEDT